MSHENKIPGDMKRCATCQRWCGNRTPDAFNWVLYDQREQALCRGGDHDGRKVPANLTCTKWIPQYR